MKPAPLHQITFLPAQYDHAQGQKNQCKRLNRKALNQAAIKLWRKQICNTAKTTPSSCFLEVTKIHKKCRVYSKTTTVWFHKSPWFYLIQKGSKGKKNHFNKSFLMETIQRYFFFPACNLSEKKRFIGIIYNRISKTIRRGIMFNSC